MKQTFGQGLKLVGAVLLALVVAVAFTHTAAADTQTVRALSDQSTVVSSAPSITPTPSAFSATLAQNHSPQVEITTSSSTISLAALTTNPKVQIESTTDEIGPATTASTRDRTSQRKLARAYTVTSRAVPTYRGGHQFAAGYCTDWAARKAAQDGFTIDFSGNAKDWGKNAAAAGHKVGKQYAAPGAIVQTTDSRAYGHVAYVEEVKDGKIHISEMNVKGRYVVSKRVLDINDPKIVTFIQK